MLLFEAKWVRASLSLICFNYCLPTLFFTGSLWVVGLLALAIRLLFWAIGSIGLRAVLVFTLTTDAVSCNVEAVNEASSIEERLNTFLEFVPVWLSPVKPKLVLLNLFSEHSGPFKVMATSGVSVSGRSRENELDEGIAGGDFFFDPGFYYFVVLTESEREARKLISESASVCFAINRATRPDASLISCISSPLMIASMSYCTALLSGTLFCTKCMIEANPITDGDCSRLSS